MYGGTILQSLLLLTMTVNFSCALSSHVKGFPSDFIWGSATAAYQVEGAYKEDDRGMSIWDVFSHTPGKTYKGETGDIADDQYHRYENDIKMMASTGFDFYRMSISPTRILPNGTLPVNKKGVEHYNKVFDTIIQQGLKPFVTLYHWDLAQALHDEYGGWLSERSIDDFLVYADVCFKEFGAKVKFWLTFNEPKTFTYQGYGQGTHAPGRCSNRSRCDEGDSATEPYIAAHNVLISHAKSVELYRRKYQKTQEGKIGITLNSDWAEPLSGCPEDLDAAERNMLFMFGWFASPVFFGEYPKVMKDRVGDRLPQFSTNESLLLKGSLDFLGLNHYGAHYTGAVSNTSSITSEGWPADMNVHTTYFKDGVPIGEPSDSPWLYATPWGFYKLLKWIQKVYYPKRIFVTENGVDVKGESEMPLEQALNDTFRVNFYRDYIGAMGKAVSEGVPVKGYTAWSFFDNYEWAYGYSKRFGLTYVDYKDNLTRHEKKSCHWFKSFLAGNESTPEPVVPVLDQN